jgi:hypothetical protein
MLNSSKSKEKEYKFIRISKSHYDILNNLGKTTKDSFDSVLGRIFQENGLSGFLASDEGDKAE